MFRSVQGAVMLRESRTQSEPRGSQAGTWCWLARRGHSQVQSQSESLGTLVRSLSQGDTRLKDKPHVTERQLHTEVGGRFGNPIIRLIGIAFSNWIIESK